MLLQFGLYDSQIGFEMLIKYAHVLICICAGEGSRCGVWMDPPSAMDPGPFTLG